MLTREEILSRKTGRGVATLPDGSQVAVRGLTRDEVLESHKLEDIKEKDSYIISKGMTDPAMSMEDVAAWAASGDAGDLVAVSERIAELSKLRAGADKSDLQAAGERPGA